MAAIAPALIVIPLVLPLPFPYKLYLEVLGMALYVAIYVAIGVRDLRTLKRARTRLETQFKDFVRGHTAGER